MASNWHPAAGVGMPSVICHPRIPAAAATVRARRTTPSS